MGQGQRRRGNETAWLANSNGMMGSENSTGQLAAFNEVVVTGVKQEGPTHRG